MSLFKTKYTHTELEVTEYRKEKRHVLPFMSYLK